MQTFRNESGGHRIQRNPPTEKRGRIHTSTITVAVLREPASDELSIPDRDLTIRTCRGSGAGGQHRNKTETAVQITHVPTGMSVRVENERSQSHNKQLALNAIRARILAAREKRLFEARAADRKTQVGVGARGDKRRTIRYQDGQVVDHITGQRWNLTRYLKGDW